MTARIHSRVMELDAESNPPMLSFSNVSYQSPTGKFDIVKNLNFNVRDGEWLGVVGPSGCGKTTTLLLAGRILRPTAGEIASAVPRAAMVFQSDTLLPHKTVLKNLEFGWRHGRGQTASRLMPHEMLGFLGLDRFGDFYPGQLSAGMKARVQLGRAWLAGTGLLLLDEPLAPLDLLTRFSLEAVLQDLHSVDRRAVLHVAHDLDEVLMLASRVLVMVGPPVRIARVLLVPFERPRPTDLRFTPEFQQLRAELVSALKETR